MDKAKSITESISAQYELQGVSHNNLLKYKKCKKYSFEKY